MTTHAPLAFQRRPFGILNDSRLRNLQNTKNRQNALPTSSSQPMKRKHSPSDDLIEDTENVDPSLTMSKRAKNVDGFDLTSSGWNFTSTKEPQFILTDAPPSPDEVMSPIKPSSAPSLKRSIAKPTPRMKRPGTLATTTPLSRPTTGVSKSASSTITAPTSGRSPKNKRIGILSRRRTASPFTRIDPPGSKGHDSSPLSIDAALSGTISNYTPRARAAAPAPAAPATSVATSLDETSTKAGWFFEIHEDTADETLTNLMEFSTGVLDISDDEDRRREKDDRGKENIPPDAEFRDVDQSVGYSATRLASSASPALKERREPYMKRTLNPSDRAPLVDLPPSDFYDVSELNGASFNPEASTEGKGVLVVPDSINAILEESAEESYQSQTAGPSENKLQSEDCLSPSGKLNQPGNDETEEIQIWESESAAGDAADEERLQ